MLKIPVLALLATAAGGAHAATFALDFEGLSGMSYWPGTSIPASSRLSNQFQATTGIVFTGDAGYAALVNLGSGHAYSGSVGFGGSTSAGQLTYSRVGFSFFLPTDASVAAGTDRFTVRADRQPDLSFGTLNGYDVAGHLVATTTIKDTGGELFEITSSTKNIHRVEFLSSNGTIALDQVGFESVQAVPEPATMAALALGSVGLFRRRRSLASPSRPN